MNTNDNLKLHGVSSIVMLILMSVLSTGVVYSQGIETVEVSSKELPEAVLSAIETDFPYWTNIQWFVYDNGLHEWANIKTKMNHSGTEPEYYVAKGTGRNITSHAVYRKNGTLLRSKTVIKNTALPRPIQKVISTEYAGWNITGDEEVIRNFDDNRKYYKVLIEKDGENQTLYFDPMGKKVNRRRV